jgi:hypothetical protein
MRGARRRGMGVNNKAAVMKTSWGKAVHVIAFIRTLMIVLAVAACTVAADDLEGLRKKAEAGDAHAQYRLAVRKKAEAGDAEAQYNLGIKTDRGLLSELLNDGRRRTNIKNLLFHLK